MHIKVEKIKYGGWDNCIRISNNKVDMIVTSDVGPRIIRYGFINQENFMCEKPEQMGKTGGDEWRIYGGHRLWHSPEHEKRTYYPDNSPVDVTILKNGVFISQPVESTTGIKKDMIIEMHENSSDVRISHTLTNMNLWDVELSVWALSVLSTGGLEVIPHETDDTGLLPNRMISLWPYTDMSDQRVSWGNKYIFLQQDPNNNKPFKFGMSNTKGWASYFNYNDVFIKRFYPEKDMPYPDYSHSMFETYTTDFMLEMETLSPLVTLKPGQDIAHIEKWSLIKNVSAPTNERQMDKIVREFLDK